MFNATIFGVRIPAGDYTPQEIAALVNASPERQCDVFVTERGRISPVMSKLSEPSGQPDRVAFLKKELEVQA